MQVKKFEGFSMNEVMASVKAEFGQEAVIIKTQKKTADPSNENVFLFEVTAAVTDRPRRLGAYVDQTISESGDGGKLLKLLEQVDQKLSKMSETMADITKVERLEQGLAELKTYVKNLTRQTQPSKILSSLPGSDDIFLQLETMGIEDYIISELQSHLLGFEGSYIERSEGDHDFAKTAVIKWLFKGLEIAPEWKLSKGQTSIHALVGPSGSGKTSFTAKIASSLMRQNSGAKVALFAYDPSKLISSEQTRLYSKILGLAFEDMSQLSDLSTLQKKHRDKDLIIIDIAGNNPKLSLPEDFKQLETMDLLVHKHLVLSCSEKLGQLDRSLQRYTPLSLDSLVFTKLDESWAYGDIFNISKKWNIPLSYFSINQDISRGIEKATRERVVERILGL